MTNQKKKILFVFSVFSEKYIGGSEMVVLHLVDALKDFYDITLLTESKPNWERLNTLYHTAIQDSEISEIVLNQQTPSILRMVFPNILRFPLKKIWINHYYVRHTSHFDLRLSFIIPLIDFKGECYHYLNFSPSLWESITNPFRYWVKKLLDRFILAGRLMPKIIASKENHIICNSFYVAKEIKETYRKVPSCVLYPPIKETFPKIQWNHRKNDFVYIGRISKEKRIDHIIDILDKIRSHGYHNFQFHLAGFFDERSDYANQLRRKITERDWIILEGLVYGEGKQKLLTSCKYALHTCIGEAFGISVAEYQKAGCITFVSDLGGAAEIVIDQQLIFSSDDEAVEKILAFFKLEHKKQEAIVSQQEKFAERFEFNKWKEEWINFLDGELN